MEADQFVSKPYLSLHDSIFIRSDEQCIFYAYRHLIRINNRFNCNHIPCS